MTLCRKKLHEMMPANTYHRRDGYVQCRECRSLSTEAWYRRRCSPCPAMSGKCKKGLHAWKPENWRSNGEHVTCAPCARMQARERHRLTGTEWCIIKNCPRRSVKIGQPYICRLHRQNPPAWMFKAGLRIVGTRVLAA